MERKDPENIRPGDKFAVIALRTRTKNLPSIVKLSSGIIATTKPPLELADCWKEWLGSIRVEGFENAHLFLLATSSSKNPAELDHENNLLEQKVWRLLVGILLAARTSYEAPDVVLGGRDLQADLYIRSHREYDATAAFVGLDVDPITEAILKQAWELAERINQWNSAGKAWRINKVLGNFVEARSPKGAPEQIHEFCRCVEGFILPDAGNTKSQFKSKTELFIGTREHNLIGRIYDARSKVEHLHYEDLIANAGRTERIELTRQAAIMEGLARHCINTLLLKSALWPYFRTDDALEAFWRLSEPDRESLWGATVSISELINGFKEKWITDAELGL